LRDGEEVGSWCVGNRWTALLEGWERRVQRARHPVALAEKLGRQAVAPAAIQLDCVPFPPRYNPPSPRPALSLLREFCTSYHFDESDALAQQLPKNWNFTRPLISASLPYPAKFYLPASLRESARQVVDSTQPSWWGLGGEAEKEIEEERKKKAAMLDVGSDAWRERKASEGRENKETINKAFGMGKVSRARWIWEHVADGTTDREIGQGGVHGPRVDACCLWDSLLLLFPVVRQFSALHATILTRLYRPTPLDAHLSSLLSLPLYLPLPVPFLADLINASFPRLWTHTALLRRTLWSALPPVAVTSSPTFSLSSFNPRSLLPLASLPFFSGTKSTRQVKKLSKTEQEFIRRRHMFYGVAAIGLVGWAFGIGALSFWGSSVDGEVEWVEEEDEEEDYVQW
jgi:hypothetical protein